MRVTNPRLNTAILAILSCAAWPSANVLAQDSHVDAGALSEVVVTGSRIRGAAPVGSNVVAVSRDDIELAPGVTTAQVLQSVPQVFNLGVSENSRGQTGGSSNITYGTSINLRGIGPYSTLTLLDGHRAVPQGTSGFAIDPSIIPTVALERIEVVADGSSAIYGSDAVAGVVNLILRRNFEGVEVNARSGWADNYHERQIGAIVGHNWGSGHFMLAYENGFHSNLNGANRDFFGGDLRPSGGKDFRGTQCNPGTIVIPGSAPLTTVSYAIPANGVTTATRSSLVAGTRNLCDSLQMQDLVPEQDHNTAVLTFDQSLTDGISLFGDAFWARRAFINTVGVTTATLSVPSTNPFFVAPPGFTGTSENVSYSFDSQLPQNNTEGYSLAYEGTVGMRMTLPGTWKFEAQYTRGHDSDLSVSDKGLASGPTAPVTLALARTDPTTALNLFSGQPNNAAALAGLPTAIAYSPGDTEFHDWELKVDGSLFSLPGGDLRTAVGYEGQYLTNHAGQITGTWAAPVNGLTPTRRRTVNSGYVEVYVPIFGTSNAIPAVRKLDLDIAVRHDNYSDVANGSTTNPKYGVNWSPVDGLTFRGSYGESFRAPLFSQLYGNSSALFVQNYSDPTLGGALRQGAALSGGNLALEPETAKTYSLGVDFEPAFLPNSKFDLTYFHIDYEKQITTYLSDLTILNRESQFDGSNVIQRNPSTAFVSSLTAVYPVRGGPLPNPLALFVDGRTFNLGTTIAAGFDLQANYRLETGKLGTFAFGLNSEYFTKYEVALTSGAQLVDQLNTIYNPARFKARGNASWLTHGVNTTVFVNYLNSYDNNLVVPVETVDSQTTVDLDVSYTFSSGGFLDGLLVGLDVVNLFNSKPPFVNIAQSPNGGGGYDATASNPIGRIIGVRIQKNWR